MMQSALYIARMIMEQTQCQEKRIVSKLQFLRKSQYWPREKLKEYQEKKLRELIVHSYQNVLFYHETFKKLNLKPEDIKKTSDLQKLPLLTKKDIQTSLDKLLATNVTKGRAILYRTGGSTGEPLRFYIEKKMGSWASAAVHRAWEWCDYNMGDRTALLWGSSFDIAQSKTFKKKLHAFAKRTITLNAFNLSDQNMLMYANELKRFRPKVLRAYSSAIYLFAKFVKENEIKGIKPKSIITTAENLFDFQRKAIEETFGCKVYDGYGGRETSLIAHECEERNGYHISDENSIVEFIKDGEPVAPGESGEMIITDLHNMVMPWLRYEVGDLGTPTDEKCNCGRTLSMIKSIDGRIHNFIVTPDGRRVPGEFFPHLFKDVDGIKEYRVIQKKKEKLLVEVVKGQKFKESDMNYLLKHMKNYLGEAIVIEIVYLDKINWPESGKRLFTISEVT
jgi:phenylacetate-CoA ligase